MPIPFELALGCQSVLDLYKIAKGSTADKLSFRCGCVKVALTND